MKGAGWLAVVGLMVLGSGCPPPEPGFTIVVKNRCAGSKVISIVAQKIESMTVVAASDELLESSIRFPRQRRIFVPFVATTGTPLGLHTVIAPSDPNSMAFKHGFTATGDPLQDGDTIQIEFTGDIDNPAMSYDVE